MNIKLPDYVQAKYVDQLIEALAIRIQGAVIELDACELQPTSRAAHNAAMAAVLVLVTHEIGQEVGNDADA